MIPLRLTLKNFLSYGAESTPIDFEPYHLICLSGKNGHGKSALLDAMTWAVWGQARKIAGTPKADQGLVRLGAKSMLVALDFTCNDKTYRIKRECVLTSGKPVTWLDFGLLDKEANTVTSLSGKTIRETQAAIEKALGLTYDTFVNSAFLRQGNANEFSKKTAKERKEIVASILGLDVFEALRKEALAKNRTLLQEIDAKNALIARIEKDIEREQVIKDSLNELDSKHDSLQSVIATADVMMASLQLQRTDLMQTAGMRTHWAMLKKVAEQKINMIFTKAREAHALVRQLRQAAGVTLVQGSTNCRTLYQEVEHLERKVFEAAQAHEFLTQLQKQIALLEQELVGKWQKHHEQLLLHSNETQSRLQVIKAEYAVISAQKSKLELDFRQAQDFLEQLIVKEPALKTQVERLKESPKLLDKYRSFYQRMNAYRTSILQQNHFQYEPGTLVHQQACPTCRQPITEKMGQSLLHRASQQKSRGERITQFLVQVTQQGKILQEQTELYKACELQDVQHVQSKEQIQQRIQVIKLDLDRIVQQLAGLNIVLAEQNCFAAAQAVEQSMQERLKLAEHAQLQDLTAQAVHYGERSKDLKVLSQELSKKKDDLQLLQASQSEQGRQYIAEQLVFQKKLRLSFLAELKELRKSCKEAVTNEIGSEQAFVMQQAIENDLASCKETLGDLLNQQRILVEQRGSITNELATLERARVEQKALVKAQGELKNDAEEYKAIAQALSKEGIQALLIEEAIPELEAEANALLARLTDNTAQISIESLRDLKNGGVKETLDIKISDQVGIRPYEMFSGGEAFRIDFALRIALSKLLARRAGTSLQTLIMDEGFGSQDDEGLLHIMDALYKIQDDFSKIIIVSHLPSMKEQFPVHFVIQKGAAGSTVSVVEQG